MITENQTKSANFIRIINVLKNLRDDGMITYQEYDRAKEYYRNITGSDVVILN